MEPGYIAILVDDGEDGLFFVLDDAEAASLVAYSDLWAGITQNQDCLLGHQFNSLAEALKYMADANLELTETFVGVTY